MGDGTLLTESKNSWTKSLNDPLLAAFAPPIMSPPMMSGSTATLLSSSCCGESRPPMSSTTSCSARAEEDLALLPPTALPAPMTLLDSSLEETSETDSQNYTKVITKVICP